MQIGGLGVATTPTKMARTTKRPSVSATKILHKGFKGKSKKAHTSSYGTTVDKDLVITSVDRIFAPQTEWLDYRYYPVDEEW